MRFVSQGGAVAPSAAAQPMIINDIRPEIKQAIQDSIGSFLSGYELERFSIEPREDFDGDDAIFVDIFYKFSPREYDPEISAALRSDVLEKISGMREPRFAYIRHHFKQGQQVKR